MSQPPKSTIFAPRARWASLRIVFRVMAGSYWAKSAIIPDATVVRRPPGHRRRAARALLHQWHHAAERLAEGDLRVIPFGLPRQFDAVVAAIALHGRGPSLAGAVGEPDLQHLCRSGPEADVQRVRAGRGETQPPRFGLDAARHDGRRFGEFGVAHAGAGRRPRAEVVAQ